MFLPSWLGDCVMATPTLRLLRVGLPRSVLVAVGRLGMDELLSGLEDVLDDVVAADARTALGPARIASRLTPLRMDACALLPNSFSSAMTARLARIPVRVGYDRDGRGLLLSEPLEAPRRAPPARGWAPIPAVDYYLAVGVRLLEAVARLGFATDEPAWRARAAATDATRLELGVSDAQEAAALGILTKAGIAEGERFALLNPGGNNPAKRWPVERFAAVAHHLIERHGLRVAINGSPPEAELVGLIRQAIVLNHPEDGERLACLHELGGTIGSLKGIVRRAAVMLTNDTGPRHMALAFGTPVVTLFGPTDPRWTTPPARNAAGEVVLQAASDLPAGELAEDHAERCAIAGIPLARVVEAVDRLLEGRAGK